MNDKGKGKVTAAASSSSSTAFNVFAPVFALSKKFEMLSESKGKSKQPDEPLPGSFLFFSSCISLTGFPHFRIFQIQPVPNMWHLLRAVSGHEFSHFGCPVRELFCQVAIWSTPPMSRPTFVLHLMLGRVYQGEARPQRSRRHEHRYSRVPDSLPRVSDHGMGNRNTG